jgi:hypothetical protein
VSTLFLSFDLIDISIFIYDINLGILIIHVVAPVSVFTEFLTCDEYDGEKRDSNKSHDSCGENNNKMFVVLSYTKFMFNRIDWQVSELVRASVYCCQINKTVPFLVDSIKSFC